jgi:ABC-type bacteriocin/lantibiotic exporter with double-glycine peptidase domain
MAPLECGSIIQFLRTIVRISDYYALRHLVGAVALAVGSSVIMGAAPLALQRAVDSLAVGTESIAFVMVLVYVGCQLAARIAIELRGLLYGKAERRVSRQLSRRMFEHVLHLPLVFHITRATGALTQTLASGLQGSQMVLQGVI